MGFTANPLSAFPQIEAAELLQGLLDDGQFPAWIQNSMIGDLQLQGDPTIPIDLNLTWQL
jgi:hypothetical protein